MPAGTIQGRIRQTRKAAAFAKVNEGSPRFTLTKPSQAPCQAKPSPLPSQAIPAHTVPTLPTTLNAAAPGPRTYTHYSSPILPCNDSTSLAQNPLLIEQLLSHAPPHPNYSHSPWSGWSRLGTMADDGMLLNLSFDAPVQKKKRSKQGTSEGQALPGQSNRVNGVTKQDVGATGTPAEQAGTSGRPIDVASSGGSSGVASGRGRGRGREMGGGQEFGGRAGHGRGGPVAGRDGGRGGRGVSGRDGGRGGRGDGGRGGRDGGRGGRDGGRDGGRGVRDGGRGGRDGGRGGRGVGRGGRSPGFRESGRGTGRGDGGGAGRGDGGGGAWDYQTEQKMRKQRLGEDDAVIRGADDSEDDDVAAMVALAGKRDVVLEEDLQSSGAYVKHGKADEDVVDFEDEDDLGRKFQGSGEGGPSCANMLADEDVVDFEDEDDLGRNSKRHKFQGSGEGGPLKRKDAHAEVKTKSSSAAPTASKVHHAPGQKLKVAAVPNNQKAQIFGSTTAAGRPAGAEGATSLSWADLEVDEGVIKVLEGLQFERPTKVQQGAIPHLLAGRDALVKAPTGSGKTLAFLVPIIQDLQIQDVAVRLMRKYFTMVPGILIGGENVNHEKARMRKGLTVMIATPGRLMYHLENSAQLKLGNLRWLVLDEADRLLDMGFQAKLLAIIEMIDVRYKASARDMLALLPPKAEEDFGDTEYVVKQGKKTVLLNATLHQQQEAEDFGDTDYDWNDKAVACHVAEEDFGDTEYDWNDEAAASQGVRQGRKTVLLSATLHEQLADLATVSLKNPVAVGFVLKKGKNGMLIAGADGNDKDEDEFSIPETLRMSFVEVPSKQRLVTLAGMVRKMIVRKGRMANVSTGPSKQTKQSIEEEEEEAARDRKIVVFMSSCGMVDLHHKLLGSFWNGAFGTHLSSAPVYKLHGDMAQSDRTATFVNFNGPGSAVLVCTDIAARGLDFPNVSAIIQYDIPGAPSEYVHRVGRTARMGSRGEAYLFLMPHEKPYVELLASKGIKLEQDSMESALRWLPLPPSLSELTNGKRPSSFKEASDFPLFIQRFTIEHPPAGKRPRSFKEASDIPFLLQRSIMQAVGSSESMKEMAGDAFRSYVRGYAAHTAELKSICHVKSLHLGHVAFSMGLKEQPLMIGQSGAAAKRKAKKEEENLNRFKSAKKKMYSAASKLHPQTKAAP
eukprot:gene2406-8717_t